MRCDVLHVMWCVVMCCDVLWCDVMWCYVMWCDVTQRKIVWYGSVKTWYGMVWRGMAWYGMVLYLYGNVWVLGFRLGLVCIYNSHAHTHTPCIYIYIWSVCVCVCACHAQYGTWPVLQVCVKCGRPCANTQKAADVCQDNWTCKGWADLGKRWFVLQGHRMS